MLDDSALEELADAAREARRSLGDWYTPSALIAYHIDYDDHAAFIAAASPDRVLALVREVQALRKVAEAARHDELVGCYTPSPVMVGLGGHVEERPCGDCSGCHLADALDRVAALREEAPK